MPERNIRIKIFIDDSGIKTLANLTLLLNKATAAEKALTGQALKKNKVLKKQTDVVKKESKALDDVNKKTRTWTQQIVKNIGKVVEWTVATTAIFGTIQALRTAIEDLVDVEFAMAGLTKVMRDGETRAKSLRSELLKLGQQYGELGTEVIDSATEFARLQGSLFEIAMSTEAALLAQAVAEIEVASATKFLIASTQQFEQTMLSNLRTLDQWNELSNTMAVRALDLAQATARAGSVIHNAGDEMAFLNGMTAALVQATGRTGQEIGNAIRTFGTYAFRLRSVALLESNGIKVRNQATGQLKSFSEVISDTAVKWVLFSDSQKRAIAQSIAGTRRQNEFLTLMREFPEVMKATQIALDSFGSAQKEAGILMDTAQKKAQQLRSGLQRLVAEYGNTKGLKILLDALNALINALIDNKALVLVFAGSLAVIGVKALLATTALASLKAALLGLAAAHPVLLALAIAAAGTVAIYAALNREAEDYLETILELAQKNVGLIKTDEQRAKRLDKLTESYHNHIKALEKATDVAEIKSLKRDIEELGKEIEFVAQGAEKGFQFDTSDIELGLIRVNMLANKIRKTAAQNAIETRANTRLSIIKLREQIEATTLYSDALRESKDEIDAMRKASEQLGIKSPDFRALLRGTDIIKGAGTQETPEDDIGKVDDALGGMTVTLKGLLEALARLDIKKAFNDAIQDALDMKKLLQDIRTEMDANTEAARHRAAMAKFAGATQVDALNTAGDAIKTNIALVQGHVDVLKSQGEETGKLEKILVVLNAELAKNKNRITEANLAYEDTKIDRVIKNNIAAFKLMASASIQLAKDTGNVVKAAELEIGVLKDILSLYERGVGRSRKFGLEHKSLIREIVNLNEQIVIQTDRLNQVIKPQEIAKRNAKLRAASEKALAFAISESNAEMERQITLLKANGATDLEIALIRVKNAREILSMSAKFSRSIGLAIQLTNDWKDAWANWGAAADLSVFDKLVERLDDLGNETSNQIDLAKAWGATGVQAAQMRIDGIQKLIDTVESSVVADEKKADTKASLDRQMDAATHALTVAEATAAKETTDTWIKEYERRQKAWAKIIGKGLSRKSITETFERIQQEMVDRWVRTALDPVIKKLTDWEFTMLGIDPKQLQLQQENQRKMTAALATGGASVQKSIIAGANYHAQAIRAAVQGTPMPTINVPGVGAQGLPSGAQPFEPLLPGGAGGGPTAGQQALSLIPFLATNIQDFTTARGGGVRAAGSAVGAGVGSFFGVPPAIGAQIGLQLTSTIQDLKHWLEGKDEELKRPQAEALREQVGSAINRGTFGNAANITNINEFNIPMGFMLPEREGMRKAALAIKNELSNIGANITVEE